MSTPALGALAASEKAGPVTRAARTITPGGATGRANRPYRRPPAPVDAKPVTAKGRAKQAGGRPAAAGSRAKRPAGKAFNPLGLYKGTTIGARRGLVAEYLYCLILVAITPIVTREPRADGAQYTPDDFVRLSALSLTFFALSLLTGSKNGARFATAFGLLITLGVTVHDAKTLQGLGLVFAAKKNGGATQSAAAGTETVDAPVFTPVDLSGNPLVQAGGGPTAPASGAPEQT